MTALRPNDKKLIYFISNESKWGAAMLKAINERMQKIGS